MAVLACAMLVLANAGDHDILATDAAVDAINKIEGLSWTASKTNGIRVEGATVADIKKLLGVDMSAKPRSNPERRTYADNGVVAPTSFASATKWPQCKTILEIRDQSACGSCWATACAEAISDRYCTMGQHAYLPMSNADLMECCWWCGNGCSGGQPADAWSFWVKTGLVTDACQPYPFPKCEHHVKPQHAKYPPCPKQEYPTPQCQGDKCSANSTGNATIYKGSNSYTLAGPEDYMQELLKNGPFEVAFSVYADFPLSRPASTAAPATSTSAATPSRSWAGAPRTARRTG